MRGTLNKSAAAGVSTLAETVQLTLARLASPGDPVTPYVPLLLKIKQIGVAPEGNQASLL